MKNETSFEKGNMPIKEPFFKLNNQPDRLNPEERCKICESTLLEYEKLINICDNCDYKKLLCDSRICENK